MKQFSHTYDVSSFAKVDNFASSLFVKKSSNIIITIVVLLISGLLNTLL